MPRSPPWLLGLVVVAIPFIAASSAGPPPEPRLSELVTDPQTDRTGDGKITGSDEFVELHNPGGRSADLSGWRVVFNDTTPSTLELTGLLGPGAFRAWINPPGEMNNAGQVRLEDPSGRLVDELRLGPGGVASGAASGLADESIRRLGGAWTRGHATPDAANENATWQTTIAWAPTPVDGWVVPGAEATAWGQVVHTDRPTTRLRLAADPDAAWTTANATTNPEPQGVRELGVRFAAPAAAFRLAWNASHAAGHHVGPASAWRVDGDPPALPELPAGVWVSATHPRWVPGAATDAGVGGTQWRWHVQPAAGNATATPWSTDGTLRLDANVSHEWAARAEVRDALGNTNRSSPTIRIRVDDRPPPALRSFRVEGQGPFQLTWDAASDNESGLAHVEVRRFRTGPDARWESLEATGNLTDPFRPGRERVAYEARSVDRAGNAGPITRVEPDHPGLHPHVDKIRIAKPVWRSGRQEVRIDFDRPMNTTHAPRLTLNGAPVAWDEARYLANATTYYAALHDPAALPEGSFQLTVQDGRDPSGGRQTDPATTSWILDRTPPELSWSPDAPWTRQEAVHVHASDAHTAVVRLAWCAQTRATPACRLDNTTSGSGASIPLVTEGLWILRATATDAAGNTLPTLTHRILVDRLPPAVAGPSRAVKGQWVLDLVETGSGLEPTSLHWITPADAPPPQVQTQHRLLLADPAGRPLHGVLNVSDRAGNWAHLVVGPSGAPPPVLGHEAPASRIQPLFDNLTAAQTGRPEGASAWNLTGGLLSLLGIAGVVIPFVRRRAKRRRARVPSFGTRLLAARRRDGALKTRREDGDAWSSSRPPPPPPERSSSSESTPSSTESPASASPSTDALASAPNASATDEPSTGSPSTPSTTATSTTPSDSTGATNPSDSRPSPGSPADPASAAAPP